MSFQTDYKHTQDSKQEELRDFISKHNAGEFIGNSHVRDAAILASKDMSNNDFSEKVAPISSSDYKTSNAGEGMTFNDVNNEIDMETFQTTRKVRETTEKLSMESEDIQKISLIHKLKRVGGLPEDATVEDLQNESIKKLGRVYEQHRIAKRSTFVVKMLKRGLLFSTKIIEQIIDNFDTNNEFLNLKGWSHRLSVEVSQYEELLHDIYDLYLTDVHANPISLLFFSIGMNAAIYSIQQNFTNHPLVAALRKMADTMPKPSGNTPSNPNTDSKVDDISLQSGSSRDDEKGIDLEELAKNVIDEKI